MKNLEALSLATTDVGSLPLLDDFDAERRNIERAILDKVSVGLDYPCYPQLPGSLEKPTDMGLQFLIPLAEAGCGLSFKNREVRQVEDIVKPSRPVGVERAIFFKEFLERRDLIGRVRGLRACVTGPFTLASYIDRRDVLRSGASKPKVVSTLAEVMAEACRELVSQGFSVISLDEPFLALMLGRKILFGYGEAYIVETLNIALEGVSCPSSIHICGAITPLAKAILLKSRVDILDHEFKANPANWHIYSKEELEAAGKMLALGCVSSRSVQVESVEEIKASVRRGLEAYGEGILIKPDCGLGGLACIASAYEASVEKLRNMVQAVRELRS